MGQTPFDGKPIHYISKQDSIHITYGVNGALEVAMPVYTYRKTIYEVRAGRTCIVEKDQLARKLASANLELNIQKVRTVNTSVEVTVQRQETENQRATFVAREINIKNTFDAKEKNYVDRVKTLQTTVKEQKRRGLKGFVLGFGVGVLGTTIGLIGFFK